MREFDLMSPLFTLAEVLADVHHATENALNRAAKVVEREAKAEIGNYQDEAKPFAEWAPLADATKADRVAKGFPEDEPLLRTGDLRESIGHSVDTGQMEATVGSNSDIAVWQELGTQKIPPRSFLGGALVRKTEHVVNLLGGEVVRAMVGGGTVRLISDD